MYSRSWLCFNRTTQNSVFNIAGALYAATLFLGVSNSSSVQVTAQWRTDKGTVADACACHVRCVNPVTQDNVTFRARNHHGSKMLSRGVDTLPTAAERGFVVLQPVTSIQRSVFYRERAAGALSSPLVGPVVRLLCQRLVARGRC